MVAGVEANSNFFDLLVCLENFGHFAKTNGEIWYLWLLLAMLATFWLFCIFSLPNRLLEIEAGAEADSNFFDGLRSLLLLEVV